MAIVEPTRQQKGVPPLCFLKLNNRRAKQRSGAAPCGTGDKIPAAAAATPQAVIQKGENEREEGSMQKVIRHIWPTFTPAQCKQLLFANMYTIFINKSFCFLLDIANYSEKFPARYFSQQLWELAKLAPIKIFFDRCKLSF